MQLVMPMNYEYLEQDEMMYLDGGALTNKEKAIWAAVFVASFTIIAAAVFTGSLAVVGKLAGMTIKQIAKKHTVAVLVNFMTSLKFSWDASNIIVKYLRK